ncbi:molybdopterin oxidoreductase [Desulfuribacillus stibiiarsenatis]|uniref:Molybdopterin oxidoreductase n=1 Tax=Desulfuribacillus stibiiarsenatis TaxID=1390249 RepID=A0A1E5LA61_9FIRM|nr:molybdopterin-dependent oxidoreductase [Desulfuribacillus stibiiarsenatis]OEH86883.1 molybdopterin oxidoreductase [Desulfuribacillus stibiiarsenatis]
MSLYDNPFTITRHACPRNCYDTCSILAYVQNGVLKKVEGDPKHLYTNGKLCAKGYSYVNRVYHPERVKRPMIQSHRGSGRWKEVSWDEAMDVIANRIISLHDRYASHLSLALNKYSGNFGLLHHAVEGMFNSLGDTTQAIGSPCWSAGLDAQFYDYGNSLTSDPFNIIHAKVIVLWGVNPAWTAVHSMPFIFQARANGATIIVIDPIYTTTAKKADHFFQVSPGSDIYLALGIAKVICEKNWQNNEFIQRYTHGWELYLQYLSQLDLQFIAKQCGQSVEAIETLASLISQSKPVFLWAGFGLQRHIHGGKTIRAINALAALTGNIGLLGGGVHYAHQETSKFTYNILMREKNTNTRFYDINDFTNELARINDPPIKLLWISGRNLLTQSPNRKALMQALKSVDLIVTVDQFLTPTAQQSDILLPTTTQFEEWDVVTSYWHHWIAINQPAINPYFESKSELEIAQLLSKTLNQKKPGYCKFPTNMTPEQLIDQEFTDEIYQQLEITHWRELLESPKQMKLPTAWSDLNFQTPSGKFEFFSKRAEDTQLSPMAGLPADIIDLKTSPYPYWFLTTHAQFAINSQFQNMPWIQQLGLEPHIIIHPAIAKKEMLAEGTLAQIYNAKGYIVGKIKISRDVAPNVVLYYQGWLNNSNSFVNDLITGEKTDMGTHSTGSKGIAFYHSFVHIKRI